MPFETIPGTNHGYALIAFQKNGLERDNDRTPAGDLFSARLLESLKVDPPTDVFFFSHGWQGDMDAARDQYNRWIGAMLSLEADRHAMGGSFRPTWIGLHWPSLPFGNEEIGPPSFAFDPSVDDDSEESPREQEPAAPSPEELVNLYIERLDVAESGRPLIQSIVDAHRRNASATDLPADVAASYRKLAELIGRNQVVGPTGPPEADGVAFDPTEAFDAANQAAAGADFGGGFFGGLLGPLRLLSYWTMKKRARAIGESGMHAFLASLMNALPNARIHLTGHSFGCIVVSSMLGGQGASHTLPRAADSLVLLQGAVSLWAYASSIPRFTGAGYFNPWIVRKAVTGPIVVSRSRFDRAVRILYPLASATSFATPDFDPDEEDLPRFGAIGAYGMRGVSISSQREMLPETQPYGFEKGKVYNLESSRFIRKGGGFSGAHSDIDGPQVAHAIWQAALV
jgi:hypothetical protein